MQHRARLVSCWMRGLPDRPQQLRRLRSGLPERSQLHGRCVHLPHCGAARLSEQLCGLENGPFELRGVRGDMRRRLRVPRRRVHCLRKLSLRSEVLGRVRRCLGRRHELRCLRSPVSRKFHVHERRLRLPGRGPDHVQREGRGRVRRYADRSRQLRGLRQSVQAAARDFGLQGGQLHASFVRGGVYPMQQHSSRRMRNIHRR